MSANRPSLFLMTAFVAAAALVVIAAAAPAIHTAALILA